METPADSVPPSGAGPAEVPSEVPAEAPAGLARGLVRRLDRAALATIFRGDPGRPNPGLAAGWPYVSLVLSATDLDGSPLLLLSDLADHSRNLAAESRLSLLYDGTHGLAQPLTGPRLTLAGRAAASDEPRVRRRFLARHPGAALYADFADFRLYRVTVERGHLVAGFGRIHWLAADKLLLPEEDWRALAAVEPALLGRLNAEQAAALAALGRKLAGEAGPWRLTGVDPEGCDLRFGGRMARLSFLERVSDPEAVARVIAEGATGAAIGEAGGSGPATGG